MKHNGLWNQRAVLVLASLSLLGATYLAAGCGKNPAAPGATKLVPLTLVLQGSGAGAASGLHAGRALYAAGVAAADSDTVLVGSTEVVLTRALMVVRDVRFMTPELPDTSDGSDTTAMGPGMMSMFQFASADTDTTDHDSDEMNSVIFRGPFVLDLLSHSNAALDTQMVAPGDYHHVQGHLQALHAGDAAATPDLSFLVGSTVYLEGDILGEGGGHFTYQARIDNEFQIRGRFTVLADTPATSFISFDASRWLIGRDGQFLDPRVADNDMWIKWAVRHSIKIGMDDDHDGRWDDGDTHAGSM